MSFVDKIDGIDIDDVRYLDMAADEEDERFEEIMLAIHPNVHRDFTDEEMHEIRSSLKRSHLLVWTYECTNQGLWTKKNSSFSDELHLMLFGKSATQMLCENLDRLT